MTGIILIGLLSMMSSMLIVKLTQGLAGAINDAGSLRMLSYAMDAELLQSGKRQPSQQLTSLQRLFQNRLKSCAEKASISNNSQTRISSSYGRVQAFWLDEISPALNAASSLPNQGERSTLLIPLSTEQYHQKTILFVDMIDLFVKDLEQALEARINLLGVLQFILIFLTLLLVIFILYQVYQRVVVPLKELQRCAKEIKQGGFDIRLNYQGRDELGQLGDAFNAMSAELSRVYGELEERVTQKTEALNQSTHSLEMLYYMTLRLTDSPTFDNHFSDLLSDLEQYLDLSPCAICLRYEGEDKAFERTITPNQGCKQLSVCDEQGCKSCFGSGMAQVIDMRASKKVSDRLVTFPITFHGFQYGVLVITLGTKTLQHWQLQLLESLAGHIGIAINAQRFALQKRRLALNEERSVIARELHDSLAQSLSYMKIQVSRLQFMLNSGDSKETMEGVLDGLRSGLNVAYRELRELLTTFRLKIIDTHGLEKTLLAAISEFQQRRAIEIVLNYAIQTIKLNENQEIHLIHLIREALANIVTHSEADSAVITLISCNEWVEVTITDNGIGIGLEEDAKRPFHYGLTIMQERARSLNGVLEISAVPTGGTALTLKFPLISDTHSFNKGLE